MENEQINLRIEFHKKNIETLQQIENELLDMISRTGDLELIEKTLDWINQRTRCKDSVCSIVQVF
ncbi:MAG: hypothetical protein WC466_02950 [Candidatus Izemoplasmatales bacterium]